MKIGLDATPLLKLSGGIGFYIFYLLDEIIPLLPDNKFILYAPDDKGDIAYFKKYENVEIRKIPNLSFCHSFWSQTTLAFFCYKDRIDLFWGTTQSIPFLCRKEMKTLFTLYDFVYLFYPQTTASIKCLYQRLFTKQMLKRATVVMAISHATAKHLKTQYGITCKAVVHPPHKPEVKKQPKELVDLFLHQRGLQDKSYFVTVGTLEPRKNFRLLVENYLKVLQQHDPLEIFPLVIVGSGGWKNKELLEFLTDVKNRYPTHLILAGRVSDADLALYLTGARHYITLSHYEGYGMPLQEARLCGTGVIALDSLEMREAAENEGIFLSVDQLEESLSQLFLKTGQMPLKSVGPLNYLSNVEKGYALRCLMVKE